MRDRAKALAAWGAIVAIALQAVFGGLTGGSAIAAAFDTMAVICHGDGTAPGSSTGHHAPATQHDCCTDCILCGTPLAVTPPDSFVAFAPSRQSGVTLVPFSAIGRLPLHGLTIHLARGPPHVA